MLKKLTYVNIILSQMILFDKTNETQVKVILKFKTKQKTQSHVDKLNEISPKLKKILLKLKVTGKSVCSYLQNCSEKISLVKRNKNHLSNKKRFIQKDYVVRT